MSVCQKCRGKWKDTQPRHPRRASVVHSTFLSLEFRIPDASLPGCFLRNICAKTAKGYIKITKKRVVNLFFLIERQF